MSSKKGSGYGRQSAKECFYCHKFGHQKNECPDLLSKGSGDRSRGSCFQCGQSGHQKNDCPELIDKGSFDRSRGGDSGHKPRGSGSVTCFQCRKAGHRKDECPEQTRRSGDRSFGTCFDCGESGHRRDQCPKRMTGQQYSRRSSTSGQKSHGHQEGRPSYQEPFEKPYQPTRDVQPIQVKEKVCKAKSAFVGRPDTGRAGKLIQLIANHFRLVINDITVYHYHISINGDIKPTTGGTVGESKNRMRKLKQKENRLIFETLIKQNREYFTDSETRKPIKYPVFDGNTNVYTAMRLKEDTFEKVVEVDLDGKAFKINVEIKLTQKIDLSQINLFYDGKVSDVPREAMQAIDIILRHGPTTNRIPIGNSLYPKWDEENSSNRLNIDRTGNKQVAFGHYQSMRLTKVGPTLLVDRSATAFYTGGTLLSYLSKLFQTSEEEIKRHRMDRRSIENLKNDLKGLRIYTTHLPYKRPYTIKAVSDKTPSEAEIELTKDGKSYKTTVKKYFEDTYKRPINDSLPCIITQGSKDAYLPLELCYLYPDQPIPKGHITPDNTSVMVRTCGSQSPKDRFSEVYEAVTNIKTDSQHYLMEFNIEIEDRPLLVPGRVIDKPNTEGLNRQLGEKIHKSVELINWVFVNLTRQVQDDHIRNFIRNLTGNASQLMGIHVSQPIHIWNYDKTSPKDIKNIFFGAQEECKKKKSNLQMILFVIPDDSSVYTNIKLHGDIYQGIVTQCVKWKNVAYPPKGGVQANLLLKINAKLGGINRILKNLPDKPEILNSQVMIIGADVTHPAPADKLSSSVAACIGSYDKDHCIYSASIKVQEKSTKAQAVEMIKEFDVMIKDLLDVYYRENGNRYPQHIIYYRDGVSESQFDQVLKHEYQKLLKGCNDKGFKPKVTFITVQKRHHTRFRPKNIGDHGVNRKGNIPPGTTVDTHVVHPTDYDFYLCSHEGIQGTSRPTHYYVLHDDQGFKADDLQKLTYYLCYTYARCDKPISIPSPVQYAHLAAYRARNHILAVNIRTEAVKRDETEEDRKRRENKLAQKLNDQIKVNEGVKNRMYYC